MKKYFFILLQDKGKRKEYAIYPQDSDGTIWNCIKAVRINTLKETIEQFMETFIPLEWQQWTQF